MIARDGLPQVIDSFWVNGFRSLLRIVSGTGDHVIGYPISIGKKKWAIAEGYIPNWSHGPAPEMISHEALCFLNAGDKEAHIKLFIYFSDRAPAGPYEIKLGAQRTLHLRFNDLVNPEPVPKGKDYSCVIESDLPIVVQHTRLDSRQAENALMTTIAYSE